MIGVRVAGFLITHGLLHPHRDGARARRQASLRPRTVLGPDGGPRLRRARQARGAGTRLVHRTAVAASLGFSGEIRAMR
jgi:hypothetical protein